MREMKSVGQSLALTATVWCGLAVVPAAHVTQATSADPCALLPVTAVRRLYADAQAGVPDLSLARQGIVRCTWKHGVGTLFLITGPDAGDTPADEAESWALTIVDPLRSDAARHVRYEPVSGVGDAAVAVVERRDPGKGFIQDGAYIAVRRGASLVSLLAPDLARGDRAEALRRLRQLGQALVVPRP